MPSVSPLPGDGARDGGYGLCGARCCRHLRVLGWVGAALSEPTLPGARSVGPAGGRMCAGLLPVGRAVCTYFRALCSLFSPPPPPHSPLRRLGIPLAEKLQSPHTTPYLSCYTNLARVRLGAV